MVPHEIDYLGLGPFFRLWATFFHWRGVYISGLRPVSEMGPSLSGLCSILYCDERYDRVKWLFFS